MSTDQQAALAGHLDGCQSCQRRLQAWNAWNGSWTRPLRAVQAGATAHEPALRRVLDRMKDPAGLVAAEPPLAGKDRLVLGLLEPPDTDGCLGRLGPYEVTETLGRGGMGIVFKAFDPSLQRYVAVKVLAPLLAQSAAARRSFLFEARAAAAVSHENVVTIHAVSTANDLPHLVMEYVAGMSLEQRLEGPGPLELTEILNIGMQAAAGLSAAHAQGLIHRDVKPANILLEDGSGRVKITDFGLARGVDEAGLTPGGLVAGTPPYMAPEQASGAPLDPRADLFSLGSVLYAACTGRPPFRGRTLRGVLRRVREQTPQPVRQLNPGVPAWLAACIDKLQAKDPEARFQSAEEVKEFLALQLARLQLPALVPMPSLPAPPPAPGPEPWGWPRTPLVGAVALALLLAGLTAVAGTLWHGLASLAGIRAPEGTLVVTADDPAVRVAVSGRDVPLDRDGAARVSLPPARYEVRVTRHGLLVCAPWVAVARGRTQTIHVSAHPAARPVDAQAFRSAAFPADGRTLFMGGTAGKSVGHTPPPALEPPGSP
ncbi:MAG TPA: serine/threonine-protein kinase [Gemmataceae bacterium]|nr:serine/threonine-protein kinase [Gemmataceae bacterium]